jgi:hypothetical protein
MSTPTPLITPILGDPEQVRRVSARLATVEARSRPNCTPSAEQGWIRLGGLYPERHQRYLGKARLQRS